MRFDIGYNHYLILGSMFKVPFKFHASKVTYPILYPCQIPKNKYSLDQTFFTHQVFRKFNQVSIRSVLMLEFANKAFFEQKVGQIGSLMTPEDRRIVKVLLRRIRLFYTKKWEVGKQNPLFEWTCNCDASRYSSRQIRDMTSKERAWLLIANGKVQLRRMITSQARSDLPEDIWNKVTHNFDTIQGIR